MELAALTAIITGLVAVATIMGMPKKFAPLLAVLLGVGIYCLSDGWSTEDSILTGIILGLSSVGLYSGTKNSAEGIRAFMQKFVKK